MKNNNYKTVLIELLNVCTKQLNQSVTNEGLENCDLLAKVRGVLDRPELICINNNTRVYQVVTSTGKQFFCNIEDLNQVVKNANTYEGYFKIYHVWNNKLKLVSKKDLLSFFDGAQLKQDFFY